MIVNSQMKHKSTTMLGVIRHLMLDLVLYFIVLCPLHITSTLGTIQKRLCIISGQLNVNNICDFPAECMKSNKRQQYGW